MRSPFRRTFWRSMPRSRRRVPGSRAAALPSSRRRSATWRSEAQTPPRRSRRSSPIRSARSKPAPSSSTLPGRRWKRSCPRLSVSPTSWPRSRRRHRSKAPGSSRSIPPSLRWTRSRNRTPHWWRRRRRPRSPWKIRPTRWRKWSPSSSLQRVRTGQ